MAASTALPPSRSTCTPASVASQCGVAITPLVTGRPAPAPKRRARGGGVGDGAVEEPEAAVDADQYLLADPCVRHIHQVANRRCPTGQGTGDATGVYAAAAPRPQHCRGSFRLGRDPEGPLEVPPGPGRDR